MSDWTKKIKKYAYCQYLFPATTVDIIHLIFISTEQCILLIMTGLSPGTQYEKNSNIHTHIGCLYLQVKREHLYVLCQVLHVYPAMHQYFLEQFYSGQFVEPDTAPSHAEE